MKEFKDSKEAYLDFWSNAFEIEKCHLKNNDFELVTKGWYVNRDPDGLVYFYTDYSSGKRILASSKKNVDEIRETISLEELKEHTIQTIEQADYFKSKERIFNDIDHYILDTNDYCPVDYSSLAIRELSSKDELEEFYKDCSEDDIDTLDLNFDGEFAIGAFVDGQLAGVSRYYLIPNTLELADITVLVRKSFRGRGLSPKLVSCIVDAICEKGYRPRYRVGEDNLPSRAIANKLGFKKVQHLKVWEVSSES